MRQAARVDANQSAIVKLVRSLGVTVKITSNEGHGFPDTVWGCNGINYLVEIKDGNQPPSGRKLTEDEAKFHAEWRGQVCVIKNEQEALELVKKMRGLQIVCKQIKRNRRRVLFHL